VSADARARSARARARAGPRRGGSVLAGRPGVLVVLVAVAVPGPRSDIRRRRRRRRLVRRGRRWWSWRRRRWWWRSGRRGWRRRWRRRWWWRRRRRRRRRWWRRRRSATRRRRAHLTVDRAPDSHLPADSRPLCLRAAAVHDRSAGPGSPGRMNDDPRRRSLSVRRSLGQLYGRFHRRLWGGLDDPSVRLECGTPEVPGA
jgi:hypothetical protein